MPTVHVCLICLILRIELTYFIFYNLNAHVRTNIIVEDCSIFWAYGYHR